MTGSGGDRSPRAEACPLPIGDKSVSAIPTKYSSHTDERKRRGWREGGGEGGGRRREEEEGEGGDERSRRVCEVALISIRLSLSIPLPLSSSLSASIFPSRHLSAPRHWERQTLRVTLNEIESSRNEKTKRGSGEEPVGSSVIRVKKEAG